MFRLLQLLASGDATYNDVIAMFKEYCRDDSTPHVLLNKYLNTLKVFGINVCKNNNYYYMQYSPYKIDLTSEDIAAINILKSTIAMLPEGKRKTALEKFFQSLRFHYDDKTYAVTNFYGKELNEQVKKCIQYCEDGFKLNITRISNENIEEDLMFCSPVELKFYKTKVGFRVYCQDRIIEISLKTIKRIEQLPTPASEPAAATVIFKIKGKLRNTYRLKEDEVLSEKDADGNLIIINRNEDFDVLLRRLLRYGACCEVISPKFLRKKMIEMITKAIGHYDT
jgi:hypothetical protein